MPLFAILHIDFEGLHPSSCRVVAASSELAIAENILENPDRWRAVLFHAHPDDGDPRSIWQRIQTGGLTPAVLLTLINRTSLDVDFGEMVRIYPLEIQALSDVRFMRPGSEVLNPAQDAGVDEGDIPNPLLPQLAEDARSLLSTQDFQKYIHILLKQDTWQQSNLHTLNLITPDLSTWLLPSLEIPVKLSNIEVRESSTGSSEVQDEYLYFQSDIQFGLWSSNLRIPIAEKYEGDSDSSPNTVGDRWLDVGNSLKKSIELSGFWIAPEVSPTQKSQLLIELTCLLSYITELIIPKNV